MVVVERTRAYRSHRNHPAFPTQWFTAYSALSPVRRAFWPPSSALLYANLTPASGCQDHTASPSASSALVRSAISVHRIPPRVRDDRETPLMWDETARIMDLIWVARKRKIFLQIGLDRQTASAPCCFARRADHDCCWIMIVCHLRIGSAAEADRSPPFNRGVDRTDDSRLPVADSRSRGTREHGHADTRGRDQAAFV